jgi:antitoxin (DNA-binding transcriptional repressor) of toxin-antitoxin stability system
MKTLTVREAETQLGRLVAEAARGDVIVLTDGAVEVTLTPRSPRPSPDPEVDSPELEAELLKTAKGPFTPYSRDDLEAVARQVLREKQGR